MKTLQIDLKKAKQLYPKSSPEMKEIFKSTFGEKSFSDKITDRIKTWEDVCDELGIDPGQSLPYPYPHNDEQEAINGFFKATKIAECLNEGWKPNWSNSSEYKYYPWFDLSGGGFSFDGHGYNCTFTCVGARLCYKSSDLATYAGKQFLDIYKSFFTFNS